MKRRRGGNVLCCWCERFQKCQQIRKKWQKLMFCPLLLLLSLFSSTLLLDLLRWTKTRLTIKTEDANSCLKKKEEKTNRQNTSGGWKNAVLFPRFYITLLEKDSFWIAKIISGLNETRHTNTSTQIYIYTHKDTHTPLHNRLAWMSY